MYVTPVIDGYYLIERKGGGGVGGVCERERVGERERERERERDRDR